MNAHAHQSWLWYAFKSPFHIQLISMRIHPETYTKKRRLLASWRSSKLAVIWVLKSTFHNHLMSSTTAQFHTILMKSPPSKLVKMAVIPIAKLGTQSDWRALKVRMLIGHRLRSSHLTQWWKYLQPNSSKWLWYQIKYKNSQPNWRSQDTNNLNSCDGTKPDIAHQSWLW